MKAKHEREQSAAGFSFFLSLLLLFVCLFVCLFVRSYTVEVLFCVFKKQFHFIGSTVIKFQMSETC